MPGEKGVTNSQNEPVWGAQARGMSDGARSPEELETLFEDALMMRDREAVANLFDEGAVLVNGVAGSVRGSEEIARAALLTWQGAHPYVANARHVVQSRDIGVIINDQGINVAYCGRDSLWRFVILMSEMSDEQKGQDDDAGHEQYSGT